MVIEAVRTLAQISDLTDAELESIGHEFGFAWPIHGLSIPVGVLIRARKEYHNLCNPITAVTTCAHVVAAAERAVDASRQNPENALGDWLALCREVDNYHGYRNEVRGSQ